MDASVHLRIGNRPTAIGRAAALGELGAFLAGVAAIGRGCREVWALEEATLVETDVVPGRSAQARAARRRRPALRGGGPDGR